MGQCAAWQVVYEAVRGIYLLSLGSFFIGTCMSQFARVALSLRNARGTAIGAYDATRGRSPLLFFLFLRSDRPMCLVVEAKCR